MYGFTKIEERRACTVQYFLCLKLCLPQEQSQIQYFPLTLCPLFMKQQSCWPVVALNNHSSLLRNANLPQCPACPTGLPPSVSPFHFWQSISPRHPPTAAAHWDQPQLPCLKICCCCLNKRSDLAIKTQQKNIKCYLANMHSMQHEQDIFSDIPSQSGSSYAQCCQYWARSFR